MKLKFKKQAYQTRAVESVVDCFMGQPNTSGISYRIDPGLGKADDQGYRIQDLYESEGFKNSDLALSYDKVLYSGPHCQYSGLKK